MKKKRVRSHLLLAATIVSLSVTMPMDAAYADNPTPTRGANAAYTITNGTADNYNFTTSDGSTTSYYKTNLSVFNLLNNINDSTVWLEGTQDNNNFSVVLPNNETRYFIYEYSKPDGWGDGDRQVYDYNGNAAGNSAFYNNRTFNGLNSTVSGGAIDIQAKYEATAGHGSNFIGTMTADFTNNSITNTDTSDKGLGGALHIWGPYAGIETLNSNFINNHITYGTTKSGGGALAIGEGYNGGESTVGLINGNFINNYIDAPSNNFGGAIYYEGSSYGDGEITSIGQDPVHTTKFVGNHILGTGQGGAIYAVNKIGSIYADFIGNYIAGKSDNSKGGAISLTKTSNEKTVGLIVGDFIGNYITTSANNGSAWGGAIYNNNIVGSITGDFIGNYIESTYNDTYSGGKSVYGGAIYNTGTIGTNITGLTGNFIGNYANGQDAYGGAIYNTGTITTLNGKFIENDAYANIQYGYNAVGGAIANKNNGIIQNISGDFIRNKAHTSYTSNSSMMATGGAIYNEGAKIGTISANFIENEAQRQAGAIYNNGNSSNNNGIGTISGNFIKNKVTGEIARELYGGAIFNEGTIGDVTANFTSNSTQAQSDNNQYYNAFGGAIANNGSDSSFGDITGVFDGNSSVHNYAKVDTGNYYGAFGGAIYNNGGKIGTYEMDEYDELVYTGGIKSSTFQNNKAESNQAAQGGAIWNNRQLNLIDTSFVNNSAISSAGKSYGGAIYAKDYNSSFENLGVISIKAKTADVTFSGNKAENGAAIYSESNGGTFISAEGGNILFENNNKTGAANGTGSGIYTASTLFLNTGNEHTITINDNIDTSGGYGWGYLDVTPAGGNIYLNGSITTGSSAGIRMGYSEAGALVLGQTPANQTFNSLTAQNDSTLSLQNNHAGDNLVVNTFTGSDWGSLKFNIDYDATANSMDKITVNSGSGTITLNAINVLNDNEDFVDGTQAEYLDGAARENIIVREDAVTSTIAGTTVYTFTPDSTTHGLLTVSRGEVPYEGDLINAIQDDVGTSHPTAYSMQDNYTADRNFGALNTDNRTSFTIFGNNHTVSGANTYTGIEVANGQILNLDSVRFSNVKTYDVQNEGTLNLSGTNTINKITDAATPVGVTNITGGTTTIAANGSVNQDTINLKGGNLKLLSGSSVVADIIADSTLDTTGRLEVNDATITGTISGTFKGNTGTTSALYFMSPTLANNNLALNGVNFDSNSGNVSGGLVFYGSGNLTLTNNQFTNNTALNGAAGALLAQTTGATSITGATFTGNSATSSSGNAYGGAIYQDGGTATINSSTFDSNYVKGSSGGSGGAIYSNGTALTITGTAENPTVFKNNGISKYDNNYQGSAYGGAIYQENGTINISNAKFENNVSEFSIKSNLNGGAIYTDATGGNISADFTGNTLSAVAGSGQGGAIYNRGTITKITGDFTNNAITLQPTSSSEQYGESSGGAIANGGTITNGIDGTFSGNTITTNVKQSDANGGALANTGTIGNITGDFLNNYVTSTNTTYSGSARGGAIYNLNGTIGNIIATSAEENGFKGNSATKAAGYNAEGLGGAIYNHAEGYNATIGNITADFINNTATTNGGAIYNYAADNNKAEIGNIIGNFTGNTAYQGSAIYNYVNNDESYIDNKLAIIGDITGNFSENNGTVIYNKGYYDYNNFNETVYAQIGDITGDFTENNASSGNIIYNDYAQIGDIIGDFTENTTNNGVINNSGSIDSITANTTTHKGFYKNTGSAIRNYASADYHREATIGNITADFKENNAGAYSGAAINNSSANANLKAKIGNITGDFDQNASTNYGGAISNTYAIIGTQNNLGEFTGTAITGNFTNNQVTNNSVYNPSGGAIANENSSSIGNIQGNFENNSIIDSRYKAMGGAIANRTSSTIGNITGNFNANSISYNPIFDTDTFEAQHYGNSSLGGAIYNDSTSTIGTLTGDFVGNRAKGHVAEDDTTTVFAAAGGAIYNEGILGTITGDIKNNYALGHSHHGVYGGAIYTTTGLNLVDSDITGNYVTTQSTSATDLKGGAIYTTDGINITANTKDISVSGNKGTEQGAAIYNASENNAVVLNATGGNITFENNNLTGLAGGSGVGIYSAGGLTLNAADGKYIAINDALNITGNTTLNGTLKLGDNAVETLANTTSKFIAQGGALDIANGAIDTMTFANAVDIQNAINLGLDVNLTGTTATADKITADITSGNTSAITLSALNFINDNYTGSEEDHELTIADGTIKSLINENITSTTGNTNSYSYSYDQNTGILTVSLVTYDNIYDAVHDTEKATRTYKIKLAEGETVTQTLGALAGTKLTVNGNNKYLDGKVGGVKQGGVIVGNGQTLELKNISQLRNFTTAVDNAGTLNVDGVTFTNNSTADINNTGTTTISNSDVAKIVNSSTVNVTDSTIRDIKNTGVLNISDTDGTPVYMLLITDNETPEGITNITGGYTQFVGNVTQDTINLKGGNLTLPNNVTVNANIVADETVDKTGYLNIFSSGSTINGTISGTFKGNDETALSNAGTIENVTANFVNNTHSGSSDIMGGAIYNTGTMGTISGNFTGNSATSTASGKNGYGGAIYNDGGAITVSNSSFENNSATYGGAIYQNSGSLTIADSTFKNNTGAISGSIYQKAGTVSIDGSTFDNTGRLWQESGSLSITDSNFKDTELTSRLGSNVTISGSTFDNSPVHFIGNNINNGYDTLTNTFSITNSTIKNTARSDYNAYALSVVGGDVTIDGVNIINNTNAKAIKSEAAAQGTQDHTHYSNINIIAQAADVNITGNKYGVYVIGWNDSNKHTTLTMYAKNHDILISDNTNGGINYHDNYGILTLNADTGHNITINDAVSSTTGMIINDGGTHAGTVALNGALTLGNTLNIQGGTLKLGTDAANSVFNTVEFTNTPTLDIENGSVDTVSMALINGNANLALDASLGDTNTADKLVSDISGTPAIYVSDINFISDNGNGGEVQIADGNIKGVIAVGADVAGGYADVQYNNSTGVLSFADKIDWLEQTNGSNSGYRFTKTDNGIMPVNYTSGENNYTFYTDILRKNYVDNNSVAHDLKYTWNNATHALTVTNSDDTAIAQTTMAVTGAGSTADPYILKGDYTGNNSALGFERWDRVSSITGDFIGNTKGGIGLGMGITIGDIKGNFIGNSGGRAFSFSGDHSWATNINSITGDFIGNTQGAIYIFNWNNGGIGTVTGDFIGNKDDGSGGAIALADSHINSVIGNFVNNYAGDVGGALYVGDGKNGANISVTGDFIANQAVNKGGAVYNAKGASTRLIDSSFIGNIAPEGAAIHNNNKYATLVVTAKNKDIEFTNNNSTGLSGGDGYGIYNIGQLTLNANADRTFTVNDKVYSEGNISINDYYADWTAQNGTVIFNNEITQTGATGISSNESNAGGGMVIFNGATTLGSLDVSGTATLKLGAGAGTSTFGAVTFSRSPILDIANNSAQTLNVASIKNNAKLNIDLDFTGDSVLADAINITTGGQTGVLTINDINAITSDTGAIREFTNLAILTGATDGVTLVLSEAIQQDPRFNGDAVETITWESDYTDNATFANTVFTNTEYSQTNRKQLSVVDGTKLSFAETEIIPKHATGNVTTQDVLQALNQSISAVRTLTTDDATAAYTVGDDLGATGTGSLSVTGTTSGENTSTLNMNGKSGFELSNSDTTLALSNLNITGVKDVEGGFINITGENSSATLTSVTVDSTTNSAIVNDKILNLAGNTTINTGIKGPGTLNIDGNVALNGALIFGNSSNTMNVNGGTLKLGKVAAASNLQKVVFNNTPTIDFQNEDINTLNVLRITGNANLKLDIDFSGTSVIVDSIKLNVDGSTGTLTIADLNATGTPTSDFTVEVLTNPSGLVLALDDSVASQYNKTGEWEDKQSSDALTQTATWDDTFSTKTWEEREITILSVKDDSLLKYTQTVEKKNEHTTTGETIALLTQATQFGTGERKYTTDDKTKVHTSTADFGTLTPGTFTISGAMDNENTSTIDMNGKSGFVLANDDSVLNLEKVKFVNTDSTKSAVLNVHKQNAKVNMTDVLIDNAQINDVKNEGILTFNGTNTIMVDLTGQDPEGDTTGTINILSGSSEFKTIDQNKVTVASGANLTAKMIDTDNGIENNGTVELTGGSSETNITGSGDLEISGNVDFTGNISQKNFLIGDDEKTAAFTGEGDITAEVISVQGTMKNKGNITVSNVLSNNGTITLDSATTKLNLNGSEMNVAGTIDGTGSVVVNGTVNNTATISNSVEIASTGSLKTAADDITGAITNNNLLELTYGELQNTISGSNGVTKITGQILNENNKNIAQKEIQITSDGELVSDAGKVTADIKNDGIYTINSGANANNITGAGLVSIHGDVTNTGDIENRINITTGNSFTTNADKIKNSVENSSTVTLTGGTLEQTINGGNINITTGQVTTAASNLGGTVTNNSSLLISGTLDKAIYGETGTTKIDSALTITGTGAIQGTLDLNGGVLDLSGNGSVTQYNINKLDNSGHVKIDIDFYGSTPISDSINIATAGMAKTVTVDDITEIGTIGDSFTVQVIKGATDNITLALDEALAEKYKGQEETEVTYETEAFNANIDFDKTSFDTVEYTEKSQKTLSVTGTSLQLDKVVTEAKHETGRTQEDALATLNTTTQATSRSMKATTTASSNAYTITKDLGTTAAGDITVEGRSASDLGTLNMNNKSGFVASNISTVTLKNLNITNAKEEDGSIVNATNSSAITNLEGVTIAENSADVIASNGTTNVKDSTINAGVSNTGTMNLDGNNTIAKVEGDNGTTKVNNGTTTVGSIAQKLINIITGGKLEANGDITASNGITNDSTDGLTVNNGTITGDVSGTGNVKTTGNSAIADGSTINQDVTVADGTLTTNADGLNGAVTSSGEVDLTGGTLGTSVTGGETTISGDVAVDNTSGSIASAVEIAANGSLKTNADNVTGTITNNNNLELTGGDIQNAISGTAGTTKISGNVTNTTGQSVTQQAIEIASGANLTSAAEDINAAVTNDGTYTMTGGYNNNNITGSGSTVVDGIVTNTADIETAVTVNSGKSLESNADNIKNTVANNGTYTVTGGTIANDVTGSGETAISGDVVNNASIATVTGVTSGSLDNTNGTLADVIVTNGSLKSNADNVGAVTNNGSYEVTGGTISNVISGTGNVNITGDTTNDVANTLTGAVTVADNVELTVGAANDTFATASSVTMGNGSTLNTQNGATSNVVMDNLAVAAGDTVNLKMDWGDTLNSSSGSIDGNLSVTDINLANTTGDDEYIMTTTLDDKISIAEDVNLSGVTESTSNFVNFNKTTGEIVSYKNSLIKAVDKTDSGMSATYVMTADETAGNEELDGTLKVQGNGHSITTGGIKVGSTTIQNADLTLEDTNMENITGDALQIYGGNKAHMNAVANDVAITGNSGNAIKLIANGTNYAEIDFDAGSNTITIDNDIVSDNKNNKVNFKGGNIQFNGAFDPAMGVVSGATVTRSGTDTSIDWTLTSGTLVYTNDSFLNSSTNTVTFNGGDLDTRNGAATTFNLGGVTLNAGTTSNFYADVDLAAGTMDNFGSTPATGTGSLDVAGLNLISDATTDNTTINFTTDSTLMAAVNYTGPQGLTALSPIYKYNVGYDNTNGNFDFARYSTGGYGDYNPAVLAAPVAAQMGGYLSQLNSYDEAFRNMDMYMLMTKDQRQAMKMRNKYAADDTALAYDSSKEPIEKSAGWFRPYANWEKVNLKNGPRVENTLYGSYFGLESGVQELSNGWDGNWGIYAGYNGSHQHYDGVGIYQNGGSLGLNGMLYKGNFFTGLTANVGANAASASTMYGHEDFAMLLTGIASKTGYNFEFIKGRFIVQPNYLMSYTFVNTFDYTNAAGVRIDSDPLHAIQIEPGIKFIGNLPHGWQPYISGSIVWNIMDKTHFDANEVSLPNLSVKPFVKYGSGVQKTWGDRFTGFAQVYTTFGGRNGIGVQGGFRWTLGKESKSTTKKTSSMPEKKETKITLNNLK